MFEPACRGGSKRSLNISNPTPKWPRSPGEMETRRRVNHRIAPLRARTPTSVAGAALSSLNYPIFCSTRRTVLKIN